MPAYNKVILMGNLTRDPELSYTASNFPVCKFGLAVNTKRKEHDEVCFVDCTAFGKTGETINQYMKKGKPIHIDGRLHYNSWTNKDGKRQSKLDVVVDQFQFVGGRDRPEPESGPAAEPEPAGAYAPSGPPLDPLPPEGDDIPF